GAEGGAAEGTFVTTDGPRPSRRFTVGAPVEVARPLRAAPWTLERFAHHPFEPLLSPSRLVGLLDAAAVERAHAAEAEVTNGQATEQTAGSRALRSTMDSDEPLTSAESLWVAADDRDDAGAHLRDLPGRGRVIGTLVHFAISQDWSPSDREQLARLRSQEVMFPYSDEQQDELLAEVVDLLEGYHEMLGDELAPLESRQADKIGRASCRERGEMHEAD